MGHDGDGRCRTKDHALPGEAARDTAKAKGREEQISSLRDALTLKVCIVFYSYHDAALRPIVKQTSDTIMH